MPGSLKLFLISILWTFCAFANAFLSDGQDFKHLMTIAMAIFVMGFVVEAIENLGSK